MPANLIPLPPKAFLNTDTEMAMYCTLVTKYLNEVLYGVHSPVKQTVTIASGTITATSGIIEVDTEGGAGTDDLVSIEGGLVGQIVFLKSTSNSRTIVVKASATINIGSDMSLSSTRKSLILIFINGIWNQFARNDI